MTTRADYAEEEWQVLMQAPVMAGTYIVAADLSITAVGKEMKGLLQAMQAQEVAIEAQALVSSLWPTSLLIPRTRGSWNSLKSTEALMGWRNC